MKEKLREFIDYLGISQNVFESRCSLSRGTITTMQKGLRSDSLANIGFAFPELSIDWLLGLSDTMLRDETPIKEKDAVQEMKAILAKNESESIEKFKQNEFLMQQINAKDEQIKFLMELLKKGEAQNISQSINI